MSRSKTEPDEDGWTHVRGKKSAAPRFLNVNPQPAKDITLEKLVTDFDAKMKIWQRSSCRKQVHRMLARERPDDGWSFNKAVCLASGSFSRDNWECTKRTMFQFVAFVDTIRYLQAESSISIQTFAQDPSYTDLDKVFLSHLEIIVLEISWDDVGLREDLHPATEHLGPQTLVFELFMDMGPGHMHTLSDAGSQLHVGSPFQWRMLEGKLGAQEIGNKLRSTGIDEQSVKQSVRNQIRRDDLEFDIMEEFQKRHRSLYWPRFEEDPLIFEGLMFHWKISEEGDDEENG